MNKSLTSCIIQKEDINKLKFSLAETLNKPEDIALRTHYLKSASKLGNLLKTKVKIYFKDYSNKLMIVHTTIWAVTTNFVVLKQGITIPMNSIVYIE